MTVRPFPFGFIYSTVNDVTLPSQQLGWAPTAVPSDGQLWVSQDQPVHSFTNGSITSVWVGYGKILAGDDSSQENIAEQTVSILENGGWKSFHESLDLVVGRFIAFIWQNEQLRVYHDSVAMRPVYFNIEDGLIASHAPLLRELREAAGKNIQSLRNLGQHKLWEETEDPDVSALPADFYLDLNEGAIRRYYPHSPITTDSPEFDERIATATKLARKSMDYWKSVPLPIYCALTGGLDTRMNAAAALGSGLDLNYVTYGSHGEISESDKGSSRSYKVDFHVTKQISKALNLRQTLLPVQDSSKFKLSEEERRILGRNTFGSHAIQFQGLYESAIGSQLHFCFVGTAFEAMREYYVSSRRPLSPFDEFKSAISAIGGFTKDIRESELTDETATELWNRYEMQSAVENGYPLSNLLYTELRAGRFQSEAINCQATAFMPINPLAIRRLFEQGQSLPFVKRKNGDFLHSFIESIFPAISGFQINEYPKHVPASIASTDVSIRQTVGDGADSVTADSPQNRNDRISLDSSLLRRGSSKSFEKSFSLESGALDIAVVNNYFLGRPSRNISLFISVNSEIVASTPIGLRKSPYHFHVEGLKKNDVIQAGIRANSDLGPAWLSYTTVDLLEWTELPESSSSDLAIASTVEMEKFSN